MRLFKYLGFHNHIRCLIVQQNISKLKVPQKVQSFKYCTAMSECGMELSKVCGRLQQLMPMSLAASWDNTGMLVEPTPPHKVSRILLTNDLTDPVLQEAIDENINLIISYHPPIFKPLKRVTQSTWKERAVIRCLENRIAVYSPHTSCDAIRDGVNDWLLKPFNGESEPVERSVCREPPFKAEFNLKQSEQVQVMATVSKLPGVKVISQVKLDDGGLVAVCIRCSVPALYKVSAYLEDYYTEAAEGKTLRQSFTVTKLEQVPYSDQGQGRLLKLAEPLTVADIITKVKQHLNLAHVRLALAVGHTTDTPVRRIAVCAGSGSTVLHGVTSDVYLTGEMSHHDVLDANHCGHTVILCDHSNTERGYMDQVLKAKLEDVFKEPVNIKVIMSKKDKDPLDIV